MTSTILPRSEIANLSVVDQGTGPTLLFLHGVGLQADAWTAQLDACRGTHHVIAPDMPGHGHSPRPDGPMMLNDYVQSLSRVLHHISQPTVVIGHSMGAMIAVELAVRTPEMVRGVVALNGIFERSPAAADAVRSRADRLDGTTVPDPALTLTRWFGAAPSPDRTACETWLRTADPKGYKLAYTAFAHADGPSRSSLLTLACPALFATGTLEPNSTPEMSQAMASLAPQGRAMIIDGAAHMMPMTHAPIINAALLDFAKDIRP